MLEAQYWFVTAVEPLQVPGHMWVEFLLRKRYSRRGLQISSASRISTPAETQGLELVLQSTMATLLSSAHLAAGVVLRLLSL